jgi:DNA-binding transcriptional LysR family regulator
MELHNVDLNKLVTFLAIAESGAVTTAAQRLSLTRSAVSHSLRALESELGILLFLRVGRGLVLSTEGKLLRQAVSDVRARLGTALDELSGRGQEVRGPVQIGLFLGFSRFRLASLVHGFLKKYPNADVRVSFGPEGWLIDQLLAGRLDMTLSLRPTGLHASRIRSDKLAVRPLVLATRRAKGSTFRRFSQICELPIVDYYQSDPLIDRWTRRHFEGQVVPRARIRAWAASTDLALELVLRGTGAAVFPEDVAEPFQRQKQLTIIPGPGEPLLDHVWLNDLGGQGASRAPSVFRALLREQLGDRRPGKATV